MTSTDQAASEPTYHHTEHSIDIAAPAETVFGLLSDVAGWPQLFTPTIHVEVLEEESASNGGTDQLLQIWATAQGVPRTWTSRRRLDPAAGRIVFRQTLPSPPLKWMRGEWRVGSVGANDCTVTLLHDYRVVDDDPVGERLVAAAVEHNSTAEMAALKAGAELFGQLDELRFTFSDSETITGAAQDVYDFINEAHRWPERLPHVSRLALTEDEPGIQHLDMDTVSDDGSTHTTTSVRIGFPDRMSIAYKQFRVPEAITAHTGRWVLTQDGATVTATSWHTVVLDLAGIQKVLGPQAEPAQARELVRKALGTNSLITLRHAKKYAEARVGS